MFWIIVVFAVLLSALTGYTMVIQGTTLALGRLLVSESAFIQGTGVQDAITPPNANHKKYSGNGFIRAAIHFNHLYICLVPCALGNNGNFFCQHSISYHSRNKSWFKTYSFNNSSRYGKAQKGLSRIW